MELNFQKNAKGKYEAVVEVTGDIKVQVVFDEGVNGQLIIARSLDGTNFDTCGVSNISNCPIVQTDGASSGDFIKVEASFMPSSYVAKYID